MRVSRDVQALVSRETARVSWLVRSLWLLFADLGDSQGCFQFCVPFGSSVRSEKSGVEGYIEDGGTSTEGKRGWWRRRKLVLGAVGFSRLSSLRPSLSL